MLDFKQLTAIILDMTYETGFIRPIGMDAYFTFVTNRLDGQQRNPQSITSRTIELFRSYLVTNPTPNYFETTDQIGTIARRTGLEADMVVQATALDRDFYNLSPSEEQVLATAGMLTDLRKTIELKGKVHDSDKTIFDLLGTDTELAYVYAKLGAATTHLDSNSPLVPEELAELDWDRLFSIMTLYETMAHLNNAVNSYPFPESKNHGIIPIGDEKRGFSFQQQLALIDRNSLTAAINDGTVYNDDVIKLILAKDAMDECHKKVSKATANLVLPSVPSAFQLVNDPKFKFMRGSIAALTEAKIKPPINYGTTIIFYKEKAGYLYPVYEIYPYQEVEDAVVDGSVQPQYVVYDSDGKKHLVGDFFNS